MDTRCRSCWAIFASVVLTACGGGGGGGNSSSPSFKIEVTINGLSDVTGLVLQNNGGDNLSVSASGTASFAMPVVAQSRYAVSILTQPSGHTCTVINGSGTVTANVNVTVACPWHVAYVVFPHTATNPNTIATFYIDQATGTLTAAETAPLPTGTAPVFVTVSPNNKFCYVVNDGGTVSAYAVDPAIGELTAVAGSPFLAGMHPVSITVSPNDKFAYVPDIKSNNISAFSINTQSGALTSVVGSPFATGATSGEPESVAIDPSGTFAFVTNGPSTNSIDEYTIDATTGALVPFAGSPFAAGGGPRDILFTPNGRFVYEADFLGAISAYAFNSSNGAVTPIAGSPFMAGYQLLNIQVDPSGQFLYVANTGLNNVLGFAINASTGILTPLTGSPFATDTSPHYVTVDSSGRYVYVTYIDGDHPISAFTIDSATGALSPIVDSALTATFGGASIAIATLP